MPVRDRNALLAFGVVLVSLGSIYYSIGMRTDVIRPVEPFVALYILAFLIYLYVSARLIPALQTYSRFVVPVIFMAGVIFRLMLVHSPPSLSTDIYRYVWDGRLTTHGINPYRYAPYNPHLASLRDGAIWGPMEYKYYQTIYMPVSQVFFAVGSFLFGANLTAFKMMYTLFDIAVMGVLVLILKQRKFPLVNIAWYALCPLPITEISAIGASRPSRSVFSSLGALPCPHIPSN